MAPAEVPTTRTLDTLDETTPGVAATTVGGGLGPGIERGAGAGTGEVGAGTGAAGGGRGPGTGRGARGRGAGRGSAGGRKERKRAASRSKTSPWTTRTSLRTGPTSTCRG